MGQMSGNNNAKHAASKKMNKDVSRKNKEKEVVNSIIGTVDDPIKKMGKDSSTEKKSHTHKGIKIFISILLIVSMILGIVFGRYIHKSGGSLTNAIMNIAKDVMGDQDPIFVLVMGVSEDISVELTDTIILMGYNPDTNKAFMLSIPRDTFVGNNEATAGGYDKINALYQSSPEKTVKAVEDLTGVNIDYYVTVKTGALVEIVDIIGGVEFDVPMDMDYDDTSQDLYIHLKKGPQKLNGEQAEQLVRFRHNNNGSSYNYEYGDNDIGRMRTQREFIKVVATQLIETNDKDKLKDIAKTIFNNLSTNMPLTNALKYIPYVMDFDVENDLEMGQLPGAPAMLNELSFYKSNTSKTKELIDSYIDNLGLSSEEKAKYIKPIKQRGSYGGGSSSKSNNSSTSNTNTQVKNTQTNTQVNNVSTNSVGNNTNNNVTNNTNKNNSNTTPSTEVVVDDKNTGNGGSNTEGGQSGNNNEQGGNQEGGSGSTGGDTGSGSGSTGGDTGSGSGSTGGETGSGSASTGGDTGSGSGSTGGETGSGSGNTGGETGSGNE